MCETDDIQFIYTRVPWWRRLWYRATAMFRSEHEWVFVSGFIAADALACLSASAREGPDE